MRNLIETTPDRKGVPVLHFHSDHFVDIMVGTESRNHRDPVASSGRQDPV